MPSPEALRITSELRGWPSPDGITVDEWRSRAGAADDPAAAGVVFERMSAGNIPIVRSAVGELPLFDSGRPVMVWFHGGGFVVCSTDTHRVSAALAADTIDGSAFLVGYRLAPEHAFPTAVDDGVAAMRWLRQAGIDPARTVMAGDSAGGNLALTVALALRDAGDDLPAAIVAVSPWTDMTLSAPSFVANRQRDPFAHLDDLPRMRDLYLQGADATSALASPLFADLAGLPPVLALVGDTETLLDDSTRLVDAIRACGGHAELAVIEGAFHTWLQYARLLPEGAAGLGAIGAFLAPLLPAA